MSKLLVNAVMLNAKVLVNAYTWSTLPFYAVAQRPWYRLRLAKSFQVQAVKDKHGRVVYSRPCPISIQHPYFGLNSLNEMIPLLDRKRKAVGQRQVLAEQVQTDSEGKPIKMDGKLFKKIQLASKYDWLTVEQVLERVDSIAHGLAQLGVGKGEKVILYADNSLEWFCTALALLRLNATTVTLLSILNDEGVLYGANQCEARYMVTSQELLTRVAKISDKFSYLQNIVYIGDKLATNNAKTQSALSTLTSDGQFQVRTLDQVQQVGSTVATKVPFPIPNPDDMCLIMYTSGTTGNPKGVMLSHRILLESIKNIMKMEREMNVPLLNTAYAAYLPMAHLYGYLLNLGCFLSDSTLALCSSMTMFDSSPAHERGQKGDFSLVQPEFLGAVPLVLDRLLKEIYRKLHARSPISAPLFTYLMQYKIRWTARGFDTPIINRLLCKQINAQFGGKFEIMLVGSAPLNEQTQAMVQAALNIRLLQAYGCTEAAAGSTCMMSHDLGYGECGVPFHSVKYYLKDWPEGGYSTSDAPNPRGEIVLGGPAVSKGYYKMPNETAESFLMDEEGTRWFETGDIGEVLPNGTLKIIDRKKDLTKLANGEFVALGKIEAGLRSCQLVENICICIDPYSNYVTALISPNRKAMAELAQQLSKQSLTFAELCHDAQVMQHFHEHIRHTSKRLGFAKKEIPARITLVKEEWSQDNNLLTAAFKLKRREVNEFYREQIRQMFAQD